MGIHVGLGFFVFLFVLWRTAVRLESLSAIHEPMETVHVVTGLYILPALLGLHFLGAIKHFLTRGRRETPADL